MASFKSLITHGYIRTNSRDVSFGTDVYAKVDLHIGPGDDKFISGIEYQKIGKDFGFACKLPFSPDLCKEVLELCELYMEQIKLKGRFQFNRVYRVTVSNSVEIKDGE